MHCAVSLASIKSLQCQFQVNQPNINLHDFGGKTWCEYHLPIIDEQNNNSPKVTWSEDEKLKFVEKLLALRIKSAGDDRWIDYDYTVISFPKNYHARFTHPARSFRQAHFIGESLVFELSTQCDFTNATFESHISFFRTEHAPNQNFTNVTFNHIADFSNCLLRADFKHTTFRYRALFVDTTFFDGLNFLHCKFHGLALFDCQHREESKIISTGTNFEGTIFKSFVSFRNRVFNFTTIFKDCVFARAPNFHGSTLYPDISFPAVDAFKETKGEEAARAYRTLALSMANFKSRKEEAMFYALEQRSRRHSLTLAEKFFSWLYDKTTDYGQSIASTLWTIAIVYGVFALFYIVLGSDFSTESVFAPSLIYRGFEQAALPIIKPFSHWQMFQPTGHHSWHKLITLTLETLQSVLSLSAIALFLLTLRWRFKRE